MSLRPQRARVAFDRKGFEEVFAQRTSASAGDSAVGDDEVPRGFDVFIDDVRFIGDVHEIAVDQHDQPGSVLVCLTTAGGDAVEERFVILVYEHKEAEGDSAWAVSTKFSSVMLTISRMSSGEASSRRVWALCGARPARYIRARVELF